MKLNIEFIRDWAFGNAGMENAEITRELTEKVITDNQPHICSDCPNRLDDCFPDSETECGIKP